MQIPSHFRQPHSASYFKKNAREPMDQENNTGRAQQIEVTAETTSVKITSGHDLTLTQKGRIETIKRGVYVTKKD